MIKTSACNLICIFKQEISFCYETSILLSSTPYFITRERAISSIPVRTAAVENIIISLSTDTIATSCQKHQTIIRCSRHYKQIMCCIRLIPQIYFIIRICRVFHNILVVTQNRSSKCRSSSQNFLSIFCSLSIIMFEQIETSSKCFGCLYIKVISRHSINTIIN